LLAPEHGRSIAPQLQTGKVDMKDYVLKEKPEPPSCDVMKIKMGLFRLRGSPVWKSSFTLRLAARLFSQPIVAARLVLIRTNFSNQIS
jgi:hypothetical protein